MLGACALSAGTLLFSVPEAVWAQQPNGGIEFQVNSYTTFAQEDPSVAMAPDGSFVVVWTSDSQDGDGGGIYAQRFNQQGFPVSSEFLVNTYTATQQIIADVAVAADGSFVVVWDSFSGQDGSSDGIFAQRFATNGSQSGGFFQVNSYTTSSQSRPAIAMDAAGDFVVVWDSYYQDGQYFGVYAQRYDKDGNPQGVEFRVSDGTLGTQDQPDVAMADDGRFVVVWRDGVSTAITDIYGKRYAADGLELSGDFLVNTYTTGPEYQPTLAMDADGDFVVAWSSGYRDGSSVGIVAQRFGADGSPAGSEFVVNSYTTGSQSYPSVAMTPGGSFVVVWNSSGQDGSDVGVFGASFHLTGDALGTEFLVNQHTAGRQSHASVAAAQDGFVVVWADGTFSLAGLDGSQEGVLGRLFQAFAWLMFF